MSRSLRRGALAATALAFLCLPLAACGAGNNAQTLEVKPDNAATTVGDIKVQNATIITQPDRTSTGPASIIATLFNNGATDQTLDSITINGTGKKFALKPAKGTGKLVVPAGGSIVLGGKDNASALLPNSREAIQDGNVQPVTFSFSKTGAVKLATFIVPAEHYFTKWGPSEVPGAAATKGATPTGGPTGSPSGSASGKPGAGKASQSASGKASTSPSGSASHAAGH